MPRWQRRHREGRFELSSVGSVCFIPHKARKNFLFFGKIRQGEQGARRVPIKAHPRDPVAVQLNLHVVILNSPLLPEKKTYKGTWEFTKLSEPKSQIQTVEKPYLDIDDPSLILFTVIRKNFFI